MLADYLMKRIAGASDQLKANTDRLRDSIDQLNGPGPKPPGFNDPQKVEPIRSTLISMILALEKDVEALNFQVNRLYGDAAIDTGWDKRNEPSRG